MIRVIMFLDLDWAGEVWRLASEPVEVEIDGEALAYPGGLLLDYDEALDRTAMEPPELGATFEGVFVGADWAALRAQGHRWATMIGAVWMVIEDGGVLGVPTCLLRGRVRGIEYADPAQPAGALRGRVETSSAAVPLVVPADWKLTIEKWPELTADALVSSLGAFPALVYGRPGQITGGSASYVAAVPGYPVQWSLGPVLDTLLLAGHRLAETEVWVTDGATWELCPVVEVTDGEGVVVPTVDLTAVVDLAVTGGTTYWWACSSSTGAGSLPLATDRPGLGSVVLALLERSGIAVDAGRMAPAVEVLDQIEVGGAVTDPELTVLDLVSALLEVYPCAVRSGPDGLWIVPLDPPRRAEDCAHQLVESVDVNREGPVEVVDLDSPAGVEVTWGIAQDTGTASGLIRAVVDPIVEETLQTGSEGVWGLSLDPAGDVLQVEAAAVYDEASARRVAIVQLLAYPPGQERHSYTLAARYYGVELGQWVAIDSESLGRVIIGQVIARRWIADQGVWGIGLLCDEQPERDQVEAL